MVSNDDNYNHLNLSTSKYDTSDNFNAWTPSVEASIEGLENERFLVDFPDTSSRTGPINEMPILVGTNLDEGAIYVEPSFISSPQWVRKNMDYFIPFYVNITDPQRRLEIANKLEQFYFYKNGTFDNSHDRVIELYSDAFHHVSGYIIPKIRAARAKSKVFKYLYSFRSADSMFRIKFPSGKSASHCDELEFILYFPSFLKVPQQNTHQMALIKSMSKLWTNFAKYGNPVPPQSDVDIPVDKWNPIMNDDYLEINYQDKVVLTNRNGFLRDRMKFWIRTVYKDALQGVEQYFSDDLSDDNTDDMKSHSLK